MRRRRAADRLPHYVYLIRAATGFVKIGYSIRPERRVVGMRVGSPVSLTLMRQWQLADRAAAERFERKMHLYLRWARVAGEWHNIELGAAVEMGDALYFDRDFGEVARALRAARPFAMPPEEQPVEPTQIGLSVTEMRSRLARMRNEKSDGDGRTVFGQTPRLRLVPLVDQ
jgi:hypothetical protein